MNRKINFKIEMQRYNTTLCVLLFVKAGGTCTIRVILSDCHSICLISRERKRTCTSGKANFSAYVRRIHLGAIFTLVVLVVG